MASNLHLVANNILSVISIILVLGLSLFTYLNGRRNELNVVTSILLFVVVIFVTSNLIGTNVTDPNLSRDILMLNLCMFIAGAMQVHYTLAMIGKTQEKRWLIIFMYVTAVALVVFFVINPQLFLLPSVPKMYFPNYYNPGVLNLLRIVFLYCIATPYSLYVLIKASFSTSVLMEKKQDAYMAATILVTYIIVFIPNFLVYNIQIDPIWGMLFAPFMMIPFFYGTVRYEMLNVRIIAKQAFLFALAVVGVGSIITLFNYSNIWIQQLWPAFPLWITAFVSAILTVILSVLVWQKLRQNDLLKYEFITTVTHKFRTPLTHIKWSAESMSKMNMTQEAGEQLDHIAKAGAKLVELTNILANVSEVEESSYRYHLEKVDMSSMAEEIINATKRHSDAKQLNVTKELVTGLFVSCDLSRTEFVMQTLIDNAINYTQNGGNVSIKTYRKGDSAVFSVTDNGIGISASEKPMLFSKLYRGGKARTADTEGMGIGLYICKQIVTKLDGKIWAESEGENKGSTFSFSLPTAK